MELVDNVIQMNLGCKSHVLVVNLAHMRSNSIPGGAQLISRADQMAVFGEVRCFNAESYC